MILLVALVAGLVGLSLGLLGGGGSVLVVPLFTYALGYSAKQAIVMSLAVVGVTSLVGAFSHWRHGQIDSRLALIFGGAAMGSAYLGARLGTFLSGQAQLILFALVMLLAALFMARPRRDTCPPQYRVVDAEPRSPRALSTQTEFCRSCDGSERDRDGVEAGGAR